MNNKLFSACIAVLLFLLTLHSLYFGSWIIDDAAITFAYSENFGFLAIPCG